MRPLWLLRCYWKKSQLFALTLTSVLRPLDNWKPASPGEWSATDEGLTALLAATWAFSRREPFLTRKDFFEWHVYSSSGLQSLAASEKFSPLVPLIQSKLEVALTFTIRNISVNKKNSRRSFRSCCSGGDEVAWRSWNWKLEQIALHGNKDTHISDSARILQSTSTGIWWISTKKRIPPQGDLWLPESFIIGGNLGKSLRGSGSNKRFPTDFTRVRDESGSQGSLTMKGEVVLSGKQWSRGGPRLHLEHAACPKIMHLDLFSSAFINRNKRVSDDVRRCSELPRILLLPHCATNRQLNCAISCDGRVSDFVLRKHVCHHGLRMSRRLRFA